MKWGGNFSLVLIFSLFLIINNISDVNAQETYDEISIEEFIEMQLHLENGPTIKNGVYTVERFVGGLEWPTTMTFIDDNLFVLEKNKGTIRHVSNGELVEEPVLDLDVANAVEGGLLGITSYENNIYLFLTESNVDGGESTGTVILKYFWDGKNLVNRELVREVIKSQDGYHHHSGILLSRSTIPNQILAVIGDNFQETRNQNIFDSTIIDDTSTIFDISENEVFAVGIRNSFGLTEDPITKKIWMTENGPDGFDEINLVESKFNSGWKVVWGPSSEKDRDELGKNDEFVYSEPEFSWEQTIGVTAISFVNSEKFPDLKNDVLVGDFNNGNLYKFKLNNERTGFTFENQNLNDLVLNIGDSYDEIIFGVGFPGITDIEVGPDGLIYVVSIGDGTIYRITPEAKKIDKEHDFECVNIDKLSTDLSGCNLSNLELNGINLSGFNLSNVNLSNSSLKNSILTNVNLDGANLSNVDLTNSKLMNSIMTNTNLENANLSNTDMRFSILTGSNLDNAVISNSNISNANLESTQLENAVISNSELMYSNFKSSNFANTEISKSRLYSSEFSNAEFLNSSFIENDIAYSFFTNADFSGAEIFQITPYSSEIFNGEIIFSEETRSDVCLGKGFSVKILNRILFELDKIEGEFSDDIKKLILNIC
ncbi:PQQ-dependent sugar dehydrogenase [Candidatus Nitrosopelagicus sp.]|nr:PQQ-dependent sugar dehydrogenase [Candidatus Nitrosopelagicus sp.]